jgi:hypothetical protein
MKLHVCQEHSAGSCQRSDPRQQKDAVHDSNRVIGNMILYLVDVEQESHAGVVLKTVRQCGVL